MKQALLAAMLCVPVVHPATAQADENLAKLYRWKRQRASYEPLVERIKPPAGYLRVSAAPGSYGHWLRHLPLRAKGTPVRSYQGGLIVPAGHPALTAVVDWDLGKRDLQQCMDTIMRLRGEYLYSRGRADRVAFAWAGGRRFGFRHWRQGLRPIKEGRRWNFVKKRGRTSGYRSFRNYLIFMFAWTGTIHQTREPRVPYSHLAAGDFFIQAGSPGHAVVIVDVAKNKAGKVAVLLAQSYMPAQDLHLLKSARGPWFHLDPQRKLLTPRWPRAFGWNELRRFRH